MRMTGATPHPSTLHPSTPPPAGLYPMRDFDPAEPAILHDRGSGTIVIWTIEELADFRRCAVDRGDGTVLWQGRVFDGWGEVLGG